MALSAKELEDAKAARIQLATTPVEQNPIITPAAPAQQGLTITPKGGQSEFVPTTPPSEYNKAEYNARIQGLDTNNRNDGYNIVNRPASTEYQQITPDAQGYTGLKHRQYIAELNAKTAQTAAESPMKAQELSGSQNMAKQGLVGQQATAQNAAQNAFVGDQAKALVETNAATAVALAANNKRAKDAEIAKDLFLGGAKQTTPGVLSSAAKTGLTNYDALQQADPVSTQVIPAVPGFGNLPGQPAMLVDTTKSGRRTMQPVLQDTQTPSHPVAGSIITRGNKRYEADGKGNAKEIK